MYNKILTVRHETYINKQTNNIQSCNSNAISIHRKKLDPFKLKKQPNTKKNNASMDNGTVKSTSKTQNIHKPTRNNHDKCQGERMSV